VTAPGPTRPTAGSAVDRRDHVAAVLVGAAGVLVLLAWLASLVLAGPIVGATRTSLMIATAPPVLVQLAAHAVAAVALVRSPGGVGRVLTAALGATGAVTLVGTGLAALGPSRLVVTVPVALSVARALGDLAAAAVVVTRWQDTGRPGLVRPSSAARTTTLGAGVAGTLLTLLPQLTSEATAPAGTALGLPLGGHPTVTATTLVALVVALAVVLAAATLAHRRAAAVLAGYTAAGMLALSAANRAGSRALDLPVRVTAWWWLVVLSHVVLAVAAVALWRTRPPDAQVSSDTA
jgi:hypothetical protein